MRRRRMLKGIGSLVAAASLPPGPVDPTLAFAQEVKPQNTDITGTLARYMIVARDRELPPAVAQATKQRILDTLGAIVSGARLPAGGCHSLRSRTRRHPRGFDPDYRYQDIGGQC